MPALPGLFWPHRGVGPVEAFEYAGDDDALAAWLAERGHWLGYVSAASGGVIPEITGPSVAPGRGVMPVGHGDVVAFNMPHEVLFKVSSRERFGLGHRPAGGLGRSRTEGSW